MANPPESYVFEMQTFPCAVVKASAVQPAEVDFEIQRVAMLRLRQLDPYEGPLAPRPWTEKSGPQSGLFL